MLPCMKIALPHSHHSSTSYAKKKIKKLKNLETSLPQEINKNNSSEYLGGLESTRDQEFEYAGPADQRSPKIGQVL